MVYYVIAIIIIAVVIIITIIVDLVSEAEIIYLDIDINYSREKDMKATAAHELQHLIHYQYDRNEETWLDEEGEDILVHAVPVADALELLASDRVPNGHTLISLLWFQNHVDSSAVMINASTRFNDGGEFGLGAEIGISTDRFHARGPCGLREIMSYKYIVHGNGQIR